MKKILITLLAVVATATMYARPHGGHRGGHAPAPRHHHHHHHHSAWGRGGSHFWPGFVGGVIGSALVRPVVTTPVITTAPVVTPAPVVVAPTTIWVEGRYVDRVQPNGTVIRVWEPGHYMTIR